ncbi:cytochrome c oxidase assembly protein [Microbacterium sp. LRZ72]|uniref:cytochrome c oxidase assembly protein n=1 Tax=Microbacterium sp. LRZ72 TaxID=2942481 RepID=UPI0029B05EA0|nr:cytochrome c oxidase assembly protein [Microbacterium sp. LRZ72]MDX2377591.1 cytochrome c oxidase assembly protein [Microbacterium sp. LRZ72]
MTDTSTAEFASYPDRRSRRAPIGIIFISGVAVALALGAPIAFTASLGDTGYSMLSRSYPGSVTALFSTTLRTIVDAASWLTIGSLVVMMGVLAAPRRRALEVVAALELRVLRYALLGWMLAAAALVPVDAADANGLSIARLAEPGALGYLVEAAYLPKAWVVVFFAAGMASLIALFAQRWATFLPVALLSALAILAPVLVHQVQVGADHDFGSDAAMFQTLAVAVLFGTAIMLAGRAATGRLLGPQAVTRAGWLMAVSWVVVAAADVVLAMFKLAGPFDGNVTVFLIAGRAAVILLAGVLVIAFWMLRRRWTDRRLIRLVSSLTILASAYLGLTVAMLRVPPPQYFVNTNISQIFFGYDIANVPPSWATMLTQWRPNILFVILSVLGVSVYLAAVIRLRRRGDAWPAGRTIAWLLGWVVVFVSTSSALGQYSGAQFGTHMIVHMSLNMLAPVLLVLGGFVTLLLRATTPHSRAEAAGPHEWITAVLHWPGTRIVYSPILVFIVYIGSYYALYLTPLFENAMRYHWAHQTMNLHFLVVGYLFYSLVIGVDRPPRPLPPIGKLGYVLAAMPFHAFFGIVLMTATVPIADNFYRTLDFPWMGDLMVQQQFGGGVAWAGGELPLLIVVTALGIQWSRQDQREAKRKDRHLDSGADDEFDAYNRMLTEVADRSTRANRPVPTSAPSKDTL